MDPNLIGRDAIAMLFTEKGPEFFKVGEAKLIHSRKCTVDFGFDLAQRIPNQKA